MQQNDHQEILMKLKATKQYWDSKKKVHNNVYVD